MTDRTKAGKRRRLLAEYQDLWRKLAPEAEHKHVLSPTVLCDNDCPACAKNRPIHQALNAKSGEIIAANAEILDPPTRPGIKTRVNDVDILLACMDKSLTNDEQRGKRVGLGASAFAKRKGSLPPEFAAIIAG